MCRNSDAVNWWCADKATAPLLPPNGRSKLKADIHLEYCKYLLDFGVEMPRITYRYLVIHQGILEYIQKYAEP